jgi:hypothetical protein
MIERECSGVQRKAFAEDPQGESLASMDFGNILAGSGLIFLDHLFLSSCQLIT